MYLLGYSLTVIRHISSRKPISESVLAMANMWIYHPYTGELMNGPGPGGRQHNNQHTGDQQHFPEHGMSL